ncbi:MAG: hypothetical protein AAFX87_15885 [Bacteroidota bacterium]
MSKKQIRYSNTEDIRSNVSSLVGETINLIAKDKSVYRLKVLKYEDDFLLTKDFRSQKHRFAISSITEIITEVKR